MSQGKRCEMPKCSRPILTKLDHESSWTVEKYFCPDCGRMYSIPTTTGKASQVSALASFGLLAVSLATLDMDGLIEHGKETVKNIIG